MKEKLIELVESYFDDKKINRKNDAVQEISGNLIERYEEYISEGISESIAFEKCKEYLGDLKSLTEFYNVKKIAYSRPISLYFVIIFSFASFVTFFVNTLLSLSILLVSMIIYNIELKRQHLMYKMDESNIDTYRYIVKKHKFLSFIWAIIFNLIIWETVLILFSNLDKMDLSILFVSQPYGIFIMMILFLNIFTLIPFILVNNKTVLRYGEVMEEDISEYKITKLFTKKHKEINLLKFKNFNFIVICILTIVNVVVSLLSNISKFGYAIDPLTGDIIGLQLEREFPLWQHILESDFVFGTWVLVIVGILIIFILISSIFVSQMRSRKLILSLNILWFISILIYTFNYALMTGINYDMSLNIWCSLGVVMILFTYLIVYNTWKVLFYE